MMRLWRLPNEKYRGLEIRAAPGLHNAAFRMIAAYLSPDFRTLDLAAGTGAFSSRLRDAGVRHIEAVELNRECFACPHIPVRAIDLNEDFADAVRGAGRW